MATTVGEHVEQPASLPTVPTVEAWRAMRPAERMSFQLRVLDALSQARAERAQARAQGAARAEGAARAVLTVLRARGVGVSDAERERILAQRDAVLLDRWLEKAVVAASVAEVLGDQPGAR